MAVADFNNDGDKDLLIGSPGIEGGKAYLFYYPPPVGSTNVSQANITWYGEAPGDNFSFSIATGDVNNDSYADFLIGAYGADIGGMPDIGRTYLFYGQANFNGTFNASTANVTFDGEVMDPDSDFSGYSVALGDVNNDNYDDIIIGAPYFDTVFPANVNEGKVYVFFGPIASGTNLNLAGANASYTGVNSNDNLGTDVVTGDIDNDNNQDIIIGASNINQVSLILGPVAQGTSGTISPNATFNGTINSKTGDHLTLSTGDVDNDGNDDVLIGSSWDTTYGGTWSGRAFLIYGNNSLNGVNMVLDTHVPEFVPEAVNDNLGYATLIHDYNSDNNADVILTAPGNDEGGNLAGKVYLFYGPISNAQYNASDANESWVGTSANQAIGVVAAGSLIIGTTIETSNPGVAGFGINQEPTAVAGGPYNSNEGTAINFDASASFDPEGSLQYRWDYDGDLTWDTGFSGSATSSYAFNDDFSGSTIVEVFDGEFYDTDSTPTTVNNVAPTATGSNNGPVDEGSAATISISEVDPGTSDTFVYSFDWDNNGVYEIIDQAADNAQYTWNDDDGGPFTVQVKVKDKDGGEGTDTTTIIVNNVNPTAIIGGPYSGTTGSTVNLAGSMTDPGTLDTHTYDWDLDNNLVYEIIDDQNPTFSCTADGVNTINLRVNDDDGGIGTDSTTVTCSSAPPPPPSGGGGGSSRSYTCSHWMISDTYFPGDTGTIFIETNSPNGKIIFDWGETITFIDSGSITIDFTIPADIPAGNYNFEIEINDKECDEGEIGVIPRKDYISCSYCTYSDGSRGQWSPSELECENTPAIHRGPCPEPTPSTPTPIPETDGDIPDPIPVPLSNCRGCPTDGCKKPDQPEITEKPEERDYPGDVDERKYPGGTESVCGQVVSSSRSSGSAASRQGIAQAASMGGQSLGSGQSITGRFADEMVSANSIESAFGKISPVTPENQEEANQDCPPEQVCVIGQCLPLCDNQHLIVTEIGRNFIEIHNPLPKPIELDNYYLQDLPFPSGSVIGSQSYLVISNSEETEYDYYFPELEIDEKASTIVLKYKDELVDYIRYGETSPIIYEEGDTLPVYQRFISTNPEELYKELIISEVYADFEKWVYYVEITNVGENIASLEDVYVRFYANDDYFYGRFPFYKIAAGQSIIVKFDSLFAEEGEPLLLENHEVIPFDEFIDRTQTSLLGSVPALEFTLYRILDEKGEDLEVLDYFIKDLPELRTQGKVIYQTAVQKTFKTSVLNFRPNDFVEVQEHSLGVVEHLGELLSESFIEEQEETPESETALLEIEKRFASPCEKIIESEPEHEFYDACQNAQAKISFDLSSETDPTIQRIIYQEDEVEGGRGIDSKDPTSEKVNEHWDWLEASPGERP